MRWNALISDFKKSVVVARYTFAELYRSKIMINIVLLGLFLLVACFVAAEFTYGVPQKVAIDFGLGGLSIAAVGIALLMGSTLLAKDVESRTIYMVLSRPISRHGFLFGKVLGMARILLINVLSLGLLSFFVYWVLGGKIHFLFFWALLFSFMESLLVLLIVILWSTFSNQVISIIATFSLFTVGHAVNDALANSFVTRNPSLFKFAHFYSLFFPNFSKINIKDFVLYKQMLPASYLIGALSYSLMYSLFLFTLTAYIFNRKNLD